MNPSHEGPNASILKNIGGGFLEMEAQKKTPKKVSPQRLKGDHSSRISMPNSSEIC